MLRVETSSAAFVGGKIAKGQIMTLQKTIVALTLKRIYLQIGIHQRIVGRLRGSLCPALLRNASIG